MTHLLTKMTSSLDVMKDEMHDMKKHIHDLTIKVSASGSNRDDGMTMNDTSNDSNYVNLYLSSITPHIAEIRSKISSEFISINRKQATTAQGISDFEK